MSFGEWVAAIGGVISALATAIVAPLVAVYRKLDKRITKLEEVTAAHNVNLGVVAERTVWIDQTLKKVETQHQRTDEKLDRVIERVDEKFDAVVDEVREQMRAKETK